MFICLILFTRDGVKTRYYGSAQWKSPYKNVWDIKITLKYGDFLSWQQTRDHGQTKDYYFLEELLLSLIITNFSTVNGKGYEIDLTAVVDVPVS